jgi:hypothetical protein
LPPQGALGDWETAADFIKKQYLQRAGGPKEQQSVVVDFVCAVDTDHVQRLWNSLRELLIKRMSEFYVGDVSNAQPVGAKSR